MDDTALWMDFEAQSISKTSKEFQEAKEIHLRNFSSIKHSQEERAIFELKTEFLDCTLIVTVYPKGRPKYFEDRTKDDDYVWVEFTVNLMSEEISHLSWTFSVADVEGVGRYYRSFDEIGSYFLYMKRSLVLEQKDELLLKDVLTVRCELYLLISVLHFIEKESILKMWHTKNVLPPVTVKEMEDNNFTYSLLKPFELDPNSVSLIDSIVDVLDILAFFKSKKIDSELKEFLEDEFADRDAMEEIRESLMLYNPIFQLYTSLMNELKRLISEDSKKKKMSQNFGEFCDKFLRLRKKVKKIQLLEMMYELLNEDSNFKTLAEHLSSEIKSERLSYQGRLPEETDKRNYVKEAMEFLLLHEAKYDPISYIDDHHKRKNFSLTTSDEVTFTISLEEGKTTLGSKLLDASEFFKAMLRNPMQEMGQKKAVLPDCTANTLVKCLYFLQTGEIETESVLEVCMLYQMANKYLIHDMIRSCVDKMRVLITSKLNSSEDIDIDIVSEMQRLGELYSDDYLLDLADVSRELVKNRNFGIQYPNAGKEQYEYEKILEENSSQEYKRTVSNTDSIDSFEEEVVRSDFDFYQ